MFRSLLPAALASESSVRSSAIELCAKLGDGDVRKAAYRGG